MKRLLCRAVPVLLAAILPALELAEFAPRARAGQTSEAPSEEVVANLAAGRVVLAVAKDAILIGTIENPIEAETRPPTPVELDTERAAVILGPVDWFSPSSNRELAQLGKELPHLHSNLVAATPHLGAVQGGGEAADVEATGEAFFERLNEIVKSLHSKISFSRDEPIAELIIADYLAGYGPEIWQLTYELTQQEQRPGYWETRVLRPKYLQLWPPEKGQPFSLVEFDYPSEDLGPSLLELLKREDPRLDKLRHSDAKLAEVANELLQGRSNKVSAGDSAEFLRAALAAIAPPQARETMAIIRMQSGFDWIVPPPPEAARARKPDEQEQRPPGAPTLRR